MIKADVDIRLLADTYFLLGTAVIKQECVVSGSHHSPPTTRLSRIQKQDRTHQNKSNPQCKDEAKVWLNELRRGQRRFWADPPFQDGDILQPPPSETQYSNPRNSMLTSIKSVQGQSLVLLTWLLDKTGTFLWIFSSMQECSTRCATYELGSDWIKQRMFDKLLPWQSDLHPGWWTPPCKYGPPESLINQSCMTWGRSSTQRKQTNHATPDQDKNIQGNGWDKPSAWFD